MSEYPPQEGTWTLTAPDGRTWTGDSPLRCASAENRERVPAAVILERIMSALEPTADDLEAALQSLDLEAMYWEFDARRKGYSKWKGMPQSERDAFKATICAALRAERDAAQAALREVRRFIKPYAGIAHGYGGDAIRSALQVIADAIGEDK